MAPSAFCEKHCRCLMISVQGLAGGLNRIAGVILFLMMLLTLADVLLRKLWSQGILGGLELSEFMMAALVFCSLALAEIEDRHVSVDLIVGRLPAHVQKRLTALLQGFSALLMGAIAVSSFLYALTIQTASEISPDLGLPRYPLILVAALGCALLCLVMLLRCLIAFSEMRRL
jgi:TRAP-type C4-dicarboxylate transport system permease small subunit